VEKRKTEKHINRATKKKERERKNEKVKKISRNLFLQRTTSEMSIFYSN
jgi:hypothetical protein